MFLLCLQCWLNPQVLCLMLAVLLVLSPAFQIKASILDILHMVLLFNHFHHCNQCFFHLSCHKCFLQAICFRILTRLSNLQQLQGNNFKGKGKGKKFFFGNQSQFSPQNSYSANQYAQFSQPSVHFSGSQGSSPQAFQPLQVCQIYDRKRHSALTCFSEWMSDMP